MSQSLFEQLVYLIIRGFSLSSTAGFLPRITILFASGKDQIDRYYKFPRKKLSKVNSYSTISTAKKKKIEVRKMSNHNQGHIHFNQ